MHNSDDNIVVITFSVVNRGGHFVTLGSDDYTIYEDRRPQKTGEFASETELPLRLALLVDTSNSARDRFGAIQAAAVAFINDALRPGFDEGMLVSFDTVTQVAAAFCYRKQVAEESRNLRPGGGTTLYDAIALTARHMSATTRGGPRCRLATVIVSDGEDNYSRLTRDQALEAAQRADAVIFAVSTSMQRAPATGDKVLKYLASETGGMALFPSGVVEFRQSFRSIAQQLRRQYQAVCRPEPFHADDRFHAVEVRVKSKGLIVRARKGYYAPTVGAPASTRSGR